MEYLKFYVENRMVKENTFIGATAEDENVPMFEEARNILPVPYWENHESAIQCYWKTWEIAFKNIFKPTKQNGFITNFIDTAFNGAIYMWDSSFILMFARYGSRAFNFQKTLDNFYAKQHPDGFICREIDEEHGMDRFHRFDPCSTGPNTMPWCEWEYFLNLGDIDRIQRVFPVLVAYHRWLRQFRTWLDGSYWASGLASGMDNQPRVRQGYHEQFTHGKMVWADTCLQQVLSAKIIVKMAEICGRENEVEDFKKEIDRLTVFVNNVLWDEKTGFYYDLWNNNELNNVKTIGAYWALMADIVPQDRLDKFLAHLNTTSEFNRPHRVPSLSADHPMYSKDGDYWRGGVWPPTNYMVLRGLSRVGYDMLAHEIALNHHANVVNVFESTDTLWENYSPEIQTPGNPAMKDFVGWTGLSPIAVLLEYVFGLRPDTSSSRLIWDIRLLEEHGVSRYPYGKAGVLELKCERRNLPHEKPVIKASSNIPLVLEIRWQGGVEHVSLKGG